MLVNKLKLEYAVNATNPFVLYVFADTHILAPETDMNKLETHIKLVQNHMAKNPNVFWVHLGDWCDYISPKDKRFDINNPAPSIIEQSRKAKQLFRNIKNGCIGTISGNHDHTIMQNYGDVVRDISEDLQIPYLGDSGFVKIQMQDSSGINGKRWSYDIFLAHGFGGGRKYGSKINKVQDFAQYIDADFYLVGHFHSFIPIKNLALGITRNGTMRMRPRWFIQCPAYLEGYPETDKSNYVSRMLYPPQTTGFTKILISDRDTVFVEMIE